MRAMKQRHARMSLQRTTALAMAVLAGGLVASGRPAHAARPHETRGRGVAELSLDRAAVLALVEAALPRNLALPVAGTGTVNIELDPPASVDFKDAGIEADLVVRVPVIAWESHVHIRYVASVDAKSGVVRLRAETAEPDTFLPLAIDLAPLLPAIDLPRVFDWSVTGPAGQAVAVHCAVQGVVIDADRLVVELGLTAR